MPWMTYSSCSAAAGQPNFGGRGGRRVGADDDFAFQMVAVVFQHEAQHVGRLVVIQDTGD